MAYEITLCETEHPCKAFIERVFLYHDINDPVLISEVGADSILGLRFVIKPRY